MDFRLLLILALALGVLLPAVVQPVLRRLDLYDVPNARSSHTTATLRGGGLAPALTLALAWLAGWRDSWPGWWIVLAALGFAVLGFTEDLRHLSVYFRLGGQFGIGLAAGFGLAAGLGWPLWSAAVMGLAAVFVVNAANFMDGINGISSYQGVILGGSALIVGVLAGDYALAGLGAVAFGAFAGFLPWNFPKAKMFLGDVGSYLLGGLGWGLGCWMWQATGWLLVGIAPIAVYATDVLTTLARRTLHGAKLTQAHREHAYQLLTAARSSHLSGTLIATAASLLAVSAAIACWHFQLPLAGWIAVAVCAASYELLCLALAKRPRR
ncbi:MAG: hypothetical protein LBI99_08620 [Propionibacteriaceae bacterium]|jgi:UDP-N-acetylmuramyl pentapeptide phosphotransferase/UDP-N-acetylglucosamine-1-phosphate transferase|nr:hypothetical protein [Propionibacteriaceae bacterium]